MPDTLFEELTFPLTKLPSTPPVEYPKVYADIFMLITTIKMLLRYIDESDAPSDGQTYGRKDGEWVVIP